MKFYSVETKQPNQATMGQFTTTDTIMAIPDIQKPFHYINPDTLRLKLRLTATSSSPFQLFLDELLFRTNYP